MSRCDGRCCASFTIPYDRIVENPDTVTDGRFLLDMLVELTPEQARERHARFGLPMDSITGRRFTCRHWDENTRLCTVYADRPLMCREYPYGTECEHGCGYCGGTPLRKSSGSYTWIPTHEATS